MAENRYDEESRRDRRYAAQSHKVQIVPGTIHRESQSAIIEGDDGDLPPAQDVVPANTYFDYWKEVRQGSDAELLLSKFELQRRPWFQQRLPILNPDKPWPYSQSNLSAFAEGLGTTLDDLNSEELGSTSRIIRDTIDRYQVHDDPYPHDYDRLITDVEQTVKDAARQLATKFAPAPELWIRSWIRAFVIFPPHNLERGSHLGVVYESDYPVPGELITQPNQRHSSPVLIRGRIEPPNVKSSLDHLIHQGPYVYLFKKGSDYPHFPQRSIEGKAFFSLVEPNRTQYDEKIGSPLRSHVFVLQDYSNQSILGKVPVEKCLRLASRGDSPKDYSFDLFKYEFDLIMEPNQSGEQYLMDYGRISYFGGSPSGQHPIRDQEGFEKAIAANFKRILASDLELWFQFVAPPPDQLILQRAETASKKAAQRVKDSKVKKKGGNPRSSSPFLGPFSTPTPEKRFPQRTSSLAWAGVRTSKVSGPSSPAPSQQSSRNPSPTHINSAVEYDGSTTRLKPISRSNSSTRAGTKQAIKPKPTPRGISPGTRGSNLTQPHYSRGRSPGPRQTALNDSGSMGMGVGSITKPPCERCQELKLDCSAQCGPWYRPCDDCKENFHRSAVCLGEVANDEAYAPDSSPSRNSTFRRKPASGGAGVGAVPFNTRSRTPTINRKPVGDSAKGDHLDFLRATTSSRKGSNLSQSRDSSTGSTQKRPFSLPRPIHTPPLPPNLEFVKNSVPEEERNDKIHELRRMFPLGQMPQVRKAQEALALCDGDVERAFYHLGGTVPSGRTQIPTSRKTPMNSKQGIPQVKVSSKTMQDRSVRENDPSALTSTKYVSHDPLATAARTAPRKPLPVNVKNSEDQLTDKKGLRKSRWSMTIASTEDTTGNKTTSQPSISTIQESAPKTPALRNDIPPTPTRSGRTKTGSGILKVVRKGVMGLENTVIKLAPRSTSQARLLVSQDEEIYNQHIRITRERRFESGGSDGTVSLMAPDDDEREASYDGNFAAQLKDLLNVEALDQLKLASASDGVTPWESCCRLFQDMRVDQTSIEQRVRIAGLRTPLYQYQAFAVFWLMLQSRKTGGGFLADAPGLGKTLIFFALLVVERQLSILKFEIEEDRAAKDGSRHLLQEGQLSHAECPSLATRPGWIACPCMCGNPFTNTAPKPGVRLALVPNSLMTSWADKFDEYIDTTNVRLGMQMFIASPPSSKLEVVTQRLATHPVNINLLRETNAYSPHKSRENRHKTKNLERFFILATAQTYLPWVEKFRFPSLGTRTRTDGEPIGYDLNINFGIACADECHEDHQNKRGRGALLAELPGKPILYGLSGTPFQGTPSSLGVVLNALQTQRNYNWSQDYMDPYTHDKYVAICKQYASISRMNDMRKAQATMDDFKSKLLPFLTKFMIRRTGDSSWFGHSLIPLKKRIHADIFFENLGSHKQYKPEFNIAEDAYCELLLRNFQRDQWDIVPAALRKLPHRPTELQYHNTINARYQSMILATCPALVPLRMASGEEVFRSRTIFKFLGSRDEMTERNPYFQVLLGTFRTSPKLMWLWRKLLRMQRLADEESRRSRDGRYQNARREVKVVILSNYVPTIYMVKLMIQNMIAGKSQRVGFIHPQTKTIDINHILDAFTDATVENEKGVSIRKRKENYQYLLGTTKQLSEGHQLTRASVLILMEPNHHFNRELQAYARIQRIGQEEEPIYTYRLSDEGCPYEELILTTQDRSGQLPGREVLLDPPLNENVEEYIKEMGSTTVPNLRDNQRRGIQNTHKLDAKVEPSRARHSSRSLSKENPIVENSKRRSFISRSAISVLKSDEAPYDVNTPEDARNVERPIGAANSTASTFDSGRVEAEVDLQAEPQYIAAEIRLLKAAGDHDRLHEARYGEKYAAEHPGGPFVIRLRKAFRLQQEISDKSSFDLPLPYCFRDFTNAEWGLPNSTTALHRWLWIVLTFHFEYFHVIAESPGHGLSKPEQFFLDKWESLIDRVENAGVAGGLVSLTFFLEQQTRHRDRFSRRFTTDIPAEIGGFAEELLLHVRVVQSQGWADLEQFPEFELWPPSPTKLNNRFAETEKLGDNIKQRWDERSVVGDISASDRSARPFASEAEVELEFLNQENRKLNEDRRRAERERTPDFGPGTENIGPPPTSLPPPPGKGIMDVAGTSDAVNKAKFIESHKGLWLDERLVDDDWEVVWVFAKSIRKHQNVKEDNGSDLAQRFYKAINQQTRAVMDNNESDNMAPPSELPNPWIFANFSNTDLGLPGNTSAMSRYLWLVFYFRFRLWDRGISEDFLRPRDEDLKMWRAMCNLAHSILEEKERIFDDPSLATWLGHLYHEVRSHLAQESGMSYSDTSISDEVFSMGLFVYLREIDENEGRGAPILKLHKTVVERQPWEDEMEEKRLEARQQDQTRAGHSRESRVGMTGTSPRDFQELSSGVRASRDSIPTTLTSSSKGDYAQQDKLKESSAEIASPNEQNLLKLREIARVINEDSAPEKQLPMPEHHELGIVIPERYFDDQGHHTRTKVSRGSSASMSSLERSITEAHPKLQGAFASSEHVAHVPSSREYPETTSGRSGATSGRSSTDRRKHPPVSGSTSKRSSISHQTQLHEFVLPRSQRASRESSLDRQRSPGSATSSTGGPSVKRQTILQTFKLDRDRSPSLYPSDGESESDRSERR